MSRWNAGTLALALVWLGPGPARAQGPDRPVVDPSFGSSKTNDAGLAELLAEDDGPSECLVGPGPSGPSGAAARPFGIIGESIFGPAPAENWRPLGLATLFTEGWNDPYARSPAGTNEAPKQNWLGAKDGIFSRLASVGFYYTNGLTNHNGLLMVPAAWSPAKPGTDGNAYLGVFNLYVPLSQRLELLVSAPFIASNKTSPSGPYVGNFGDLTIETRLRLIERRNFTLLASLDARTPTGKTVNGNDINFVSPGLQFWWNFAPKWVARGGTGINVDTGRRSATNVYFNNLAVGRYLTTKNARVFKELVVYASATVLSDVAGRKGHISDVYLTSGVRFGLDDDQKWYAMGAVQVPVSGPQPYNWQPAFMLVRNY